MTEHNSEPNRQHSKYSLILMKEKKKEKKGNSIYICAHKLLQDYKTKSLLLLVLLLNNFIEMDLFITFAFSNSDKIKNGFYINHSSRHVFKFILFFVMQSRTMALGTIIFVYLIKKKKKRFNVSMIDS